MTSQDIVERWGVQLEGQQVLFPDPDLVLRRTEWRATGDAPFDREALAHWWMQVYVPNGKGDEQTPQTVYSSYSSAVYNLFPHVRPGGYSPVTGQSQLDVVCYNSGNHFDDVVPMLAELGLWLPLLKPISGEYDSRQYQHLGILEHTLSEGGCYSLHLYSPDEVKLHRIRYHRHSVLERFASLRDALAYVVEHHWYEKVGE